MPRSDASYHPDPAINAEIEADALAAEKFDLAHGYPPRWWVCPECGASHKRGHFMSIGVHRCLGCGYSGPSGRMHTNPPKSCAAPSTTARREESK